MTHWKEAVAPPPFLVSTQTSADTFDDHTWAGYAVTGQQGEPDFTVAQSLWVEPTVYRSVTSSTRPGYCNAGAVEESTWVGIGGAGSSPVVGQVGTAVEVKRLAPHQAWWEIYPGYNMMPIVDLITKAGTDIFAQVNYDSKTGYKFWLEDVSTGMSVPPISINDKNGGSLDHRGDHRTPFYQ